MADDSFLQIEEHEHYTQVTVVKQCGISWSIDGTLWTEALHLATPGTVWRDFGAPAGARRNYAARVGNRTVQSYWHREAALAFAEVMSPWFGPRWHGKVRSFEHLSVHEETELFVALDKFIRARIDESGEPEALTARLEASYGKCALTPAGHPEPKYVPCVPRDWSGMFDLAKRWRTHPDFKSEWAA